MKTNRGWAGGMAALLLAGCATPEPAPRSRSTGGSIVGVEDVLRAAGDARREFFDAGGKRIDRRQPGAAGSVSVYRPDGTGQDNYSYNEAGRVLRHLRSYGENYSAGVWVDARPPEPSSPLP